jgi:hypothetical protein
VVIAREAQKILKIYGLVYGLLSATMFAMLVSGSQLRRAGVSTEERESSRLTLRVQ